MANQHFQQQQSDQYDWCDRREREEQEDRDRYESIVSRSPNFNEFFEEMIEERLLEVYVRETMHPKDRWEEGQLYELEGITALEQLALVQDEVEQSQRIHELEALEEEEQKAQQQIAAE